MSSESWRYVLLVDGREVEVGDGEVTMGRSRTSVVRVDHESVSRSHALLTFDQGNVTFRDLNSSNGSYIAGKRVQAEVRIGDGERIQLGAAVVSLKIVAPTQLAEKTARMEAGRDLAAASGARSASSSPPPEPISVPHEVLTSKAGGGEPVALPPENHPLAISADELFEQVNQRAGRADSQIPETEADRPLIAGGGKPGVPPVPEPAPVAPPPQPPEPVPPRRAEPRPESYPLPPHIKVVEPPPVRPVDPSLSQIPIRRKEDEYGSYGSEEGMLETAGIGPRVAALLVDWVILSAINFLFLTPLFLAYFFVGQGSQQTGAPGWILTAVSLLSAFLILAADLWYILGGWARNGKTPGKSLLGLQIVVSPGPPQRGLGFRIAVLRALWYAVGMVPLGAGLWMALFRSDRKALHDLLAGTRVVKAN